MNFKLTGAVAATILAISGLTACGGSDSSSSSGDYCGDLKSAQSNLSNIGSLDTVTPDKFNAVLDAVHKIADEAPADIKPSWTLLSSGFDSFKQILADAGLSISDLGDIEKGNLPGNLTIAKAQELAQKLQNIDTSGFSAAQTKIETEVKSKCNIDLNAS